MTVYIIQDSEGRNWTPALKYGDLIPLFGPRTQIHLSATPAINKLRRELKNFNDDDYLLLSGDPVLIGLGIIIAAEVNVGKVAILKWQRNEKVYVPVKIDLHEKQKGEFD